MTAVFWTWQGWSALVAVGTLTLASVTGWLAWSTRDDVRASRRTAETAQEANKLAQRQWTLRPRLTLRADDEKVHSHAERPDELIVRMLVENAPGLRAATGARVLVDRCITAAGDVITFGSPALGWTSAAARDEEVVLFAGSARVVDLGRLIRSGSDERTPAFVFDPLAPPSSDPPPPGCSKSGCPS